MALSFCSDWNHVHHQDPEMLIMSSFGQPEFYLNNTIDDPFIDPNELFSSDNDTNFLPYFSSPTDVDHSLLLEIFPPHVYQFDGGRYSKHPKTAGDYCDQYYSADFFHGLPEVQIPSTYSAGKEKKTVARAGLSAQSVAARERRRKISDKTQELGKLIPGGYKMNTAQMFQAAFCYVKFLKAQLGILRLLDSIQEKKEVELHTQELGTLLASPKIQEKLYTEEKCLVPKKFLETLANDTEIKSKPLVSEEIDHFLKING